MTGGATRYIYFVTGAGKTKIGLAENVPKRIESLRVGSPVPLTLVCQVKGDIALERALHKLLLDDHSHGEWFWGVLTEDDAKLLTKQAEEMLDGKQPLGRRRHPLAELNPAAAAAYLEAQDRAGVAVRPDIRRSLEEIVALG